MKKLLILLFVLSSYLSFAQVAPGNVIRVLSSNSTFSNVGTGIIIIDASTGKQYVTLKPIASKTIATCVMGTDIRDQQNSDNVSEGSTNKYYTDARVAANSTVAANTAKVSFPGFGTTSSTATVGNDSRVLNGQAAYGWGNHASVGYWYSSNHPTTLAGYGITDTPWATFPSIPYGNNNIGSTDISNGDINTIYRAGFYVGYNTSNFFNNGDFGIINIPAWGATNSANRYNIQVGGNIGGDLYFRSTDISGTGTWKKIWDNANLTSGLISNYLSKWNGYSFVNTQISEYLGVVSIISSGNWIGTSISGTGGSDRVVIGNLSGGATIGAHNSALNAWANLSINPGAGSVLIGSSGTGAYVSILSNNASTSPTTGGLIVGGGGGFAGNINSGGTVTASNFILSSDSTLKRNIKILSFKKLPINFYSYSFKDDPTNENRYGVIAQEVQKYDPSLVIVNQSTKKLQVKYIDLIMLMLSNQNYANEEISTFILNLAKENEKLKCDYERLMSRIETLEGIINRNNELKISN